MCRLVGITNLCRARMIPDAFLKVCVWTRWCSGVGRLRQNGRLLGVDDQHVLAESQIDFELKELEGHVTNVNLFTGVQFQQYGLHHVEIMLDQELRLRYPLPVIQVS